MSVEKNSYGVPSSVQDWRLRLREKRKRSCKNTRRHQEACPIAVVNPATAYKEIIALESIYLLPLTK